MKLFKVLIIAQKDWKLVRQNRFALIPMILIPLIFILLVPLIFTLIIPNIGISAEDFREETDLEYFIQILPNDLRESLSNMDPAQSLIISVLGYLFAPMFLIIPLMFATTIAVESFAGERERKTLEALLYLPISDRELFLGKALAAAIPAILITWICFVLYSLILNLGPYSLFQRIWFPLPVWWLLIFWVSPALVAMSISLTVMISTKIQTFMGAYQTSTATVLIVVLIFGGQISGAFFLSPLIAFFMGILGWILAGVVGMYAIRSFNRQTLIIER